jgi:F-type H+-transporting ATPase subunit b
MQFDWWTFAFQIVNILVLIWLLRLFLFRPVARIIAERKAETDRVLQEAEVAKQAAITAQLAAQAENKRISAERFDLLEAARAEAEKQKDVLLEKAKDEADGIVQNAKAVAARTEDEERRKRVRRAADLSVAITRRLLANLPDDVRLAGYPKRLADALSELDSGQKAAMAANTDDLHLVAPRSLSEEEMTAARDAVGSFLKLDGTLPVEVDESLIAGLELRSRHGVIHNSLGSDLERMTEALANDAQD